MQRICNPAICCCCYCCGLNYRNLIDFVLHHTCSSCCCDCSKANCNSSICFCCCPIINSSFCTSWTGGEINTVVVVAGAEGGCMTFSDDVPKPEVAAVAGLAVIIGVTFRETGTVTGTGGFGLICFSFDEGGGAGEEGVVEAEEVEFVVYFRSADVLLVVVVLEEEGAEVVV